MPNLEEIDLHVFITHFVPPRPTYVSYFRDFFKPRFSTEYLRSWARLLKHRTRGNQPWKKDVMTSVRREMDDFRFQFLNNQVLALTQIGVRNLRIHLHTNSSIASEKLHEIWQHIELEIHVHPEYNSMNVLNNSPWKTNKGKSPWLLAWEHKKSMQYAVAKSSSSSVFLCLENDSLFTESNLRYFLEYKDDLARLGLLPSFLQTEFSNSLDQFVAVGVFENEELSLQDLSQVKLKNQVFVQLPNPYSGLIILDQVQAKRYVESAAFTESESRSLTWWDIGARAAMGPQFVDVPEGFTSRNVVPVTKNGKGVLECAWVPHQPNIYVRKRNFTRGLTPSTLFHD